MNPANLLSLKMTDVRLNDVLLSGEVEFEGRKWAALPREHTREALIFELRDPSTIQRPRGVAYWNEVVRAYSLTATGIPCLVVAAYGAYSGWEGFVFRGVSALLGALLLQVAINVWNDFQDHLKLIDLPGQNGGSGVIQKGWISATQVRALGWKSLVAGVLLGLPAVLSEPDLLLGIAMGGGVGTLLYSARILGLKYWALGDLTVGLLCGPLLTLGYSAAAFGRWDAGVLWLGGSFGLAACAILHANNLQDIPIDTERGARTVASLLGFQASRSVLAAYAMGALVCLGLGVFRGDLPLPMLGAALVAFVPMARVVRDGWVASSPFSASLAGLRVRAAQAHLLLGGLILISLGVAVAVAFIRRVI